MFEKITLNWGGRDYVIPPERVMRAIACIEDHVTLGELSRSFERRSPPLGKIAAAFASVLRLAGATVADDEVYHGMFAGDGKDQLHIMEAVSALLGMMVPPERLRALQAKAGDDDAPKENRRARRAAASSSKTGTRRSSSKASASAPATSGA